jgi:hypothetical protein
MMRPLATMCRMLGYEGLRSDGLTTREREELNRLRLENRVLRGIPRVWLMVRSIGESSLPFFPNTVYETGSTPPASVSL